MYLKRANLSSVVFYQHRGQMHLDMRWQGAKSIAQKSRTYDDVITKVHYNYYINQNEKF